MENKNKFEILLQLWCSDNINHYLIAQAISTIATEFEIDTPHLCLEQSVEVLNKLRQERTITGAMSDNVLAVLQGLLSKKPLQDEIVLDENLVQ